ncbi:DUF6503 family protein [Aquimarina longa]|uniref:DUF6503 family protein n=1 Tax=Aquimarina longa TaxID=1080221 RepID=UPI000784625D|nr:DUF6503 family protein [Aquimarina longa]
MKNLLIGLLLITTVISCKQETTSEKKTQIKEETILDRSNDFPKDIAAVFNAHGGIKAFDQMNTLIFEMVKPEGNEKHTIDLKTRHARIETDQFILGFDGEEAWLEQDSTYFNGNPRFYHNLMFYFYAMPFVLGDDGISYEKVEDLKVENSSYLGYKVSYDDGVGDSPKDNYFLYYDKVSGKMKYLAYTVTFFSKEESKKISLIEYADWENIDGLLFPKTLKWREYKDGVVGEIKGERNFVNASVSKEKPLPSLFQKTVLEKDKTI